MYSCNDCGKLDKTRKEKSETGHFRYGCNSNGRGYICGWIANDNDLKNMGGTCWVKKEDNQIRMEL